MNTKTLVFTLTILSISGCNLGGGSDDPSGSNSNEGIANPSQPDIEGPAATPEEEPAAEPEEPPVTEPEEQPATNPTPPVIQPEQPPVTEPPIVTQPAQPPVVVVPPAEPVVELPVDEDRLIVELQDTDGDALTYMYEAEIWDIKEFIPATDFSGGWVSECIARVIVGGNENQTGSFEYTFNFSADSVSQDITYYADDFCSEYTSSQSTSGFYTYSSEILDDKEVINIASSDQNLDIEGQYLMSDDNTKLIIIKENSLRLGFVKQ